MPQVWTSAPVSIQHDLDHWPFRLDAPHEAVHAAPSPDIRPVTVAPEDSLAPELIQRLCHLGPGGRVVDEVVGVARLDRTTVAGSRHGANVLLE